MRCSYLPPALMPSPCKANLREYRTTRWIRICRWDNRRPASSRRRACKHYYLVAILVQFQLWNPLDWARSLELRATDKLPIDGKSENRKHSHLLSLNWNGFDSFEYPRVPFWLTAATRYSYHRPIFNGKMLLILKFAKRILHDKRRMTQSRNNETEITVRCRPATAEFLFRSDAPQTSGSVYAEKMCDRHELVLQQ